MSEVLQGVLIGALISPILNAIGYIVRRRFEHRDRRRGERRQALTDFQDALVDLTRAEEAYSASGDDNEIRQEIVTTKRRIRVLAARIGDPKLYEMVNTPFERGIVIGEVTRIPPPEPGEPGDRFDKWNERVRALFEEL